MFLRFILIDTENYKNKETNKQKTLLTQNKLNLNSCTINT